MKSALAAGAVTAALITTAVGAAPLAVGPGDGSRLIFTKVHGQDEWFQGGTADLVVTASDGSRATTLAKNARDPSVSPDGRRIAFLRGGSGDGTDIWVMSSDGSGQRRIVSLGRNHEPEWSADGRRVFFGRWSRVWQSAIFVSRSDGTGIRRLTPWSYSCQEHFDASPDGRLLAFAESSCDRPSSGTLAAIDMTGRRVPLLDGWAPPRGTPLDWPQWPAWSPDGTLLAFSTIEAWASGSVYVAKPNGTNARRLVGSALPTASPAWSPDGQWIAFTRERILDHGFPGDIWLVRADGTGLRRITNTKMIDERSPEWLPAPSG